MLDRKQPGEDGYGDPPVPDDGTNGDEDTEAAG